MQPILLLLFFTIFLFIFFLYVLICGNNKFHRDGCIGEIYYSLMFRFPNFLNTFFLKFVPEKFKSKDPKDPVCLGQGGFCRYFIILFYLSFYLAFFVIYMVYLFPNMHILYPENTRFFIILHIISASASWIIVIALQFMDPGEITATNVLSYLKDYPFDNVLYKKGNMCRTLHIPVVPRSRYCRYTHKRVAYAFLLVFFFILFCWNEKSKIIYYLFLFDSNKKKKKKTFFFQKANF